MNRQEKDRFGSSRFGATGSDGSRPEGPSGAPLVIAFILIGAIVLGLGYSLLRRNQEPKGIAGPALAPMASTPSAQAHPGSAAPADSAASKPRSGFVETLTN